MATSVRTCWRMRTRHSGSRVASGLSSQKSKVLGLPRDISAFSRACHTVATPWMTIPQRPGGFLLHLLSSNIATILGQSKAKEGPMRQHIVTGGVLVCAVLWLASCQTLSDVVQAKTQGVGPR